MESVDITELVPDYYDEFHCIGGDCKYTCCQEWPIDFSKADYKRLRNLRLSSEDRQILRNTIRQTKENEASRFGHIALKEDGTCGFLLENGLCRLHQLAGEKNLPEVCRLYPRIAVPVQNRVIEKSLRLECEAVVQLLMQKRDGIQFTTRPTAEQLKLLRRTRLVDEKPVTQSVFIMKQITGDYRIDTAENEKNPLLRFYFEIKTLFIAILQNREYTFHQRLLYLGVILRALLKLEEEGRTADVSALVAEELGRKKSEKICAAMNGLPVDDSIGVGWLMKLAGIAPLQGLPTYRKEVEQVVKALGIEWNGEAFVFLTSAYAEGKRLFDAYCTENPHFMENISVALLQRLCIPFGGIYIGYDPDRRRDLWKNYRLFCGYLAIIQFVLRARFLTEIPEEKDIARLVAVICRHLPNVPEAIKEFEETMTPGIDAHPLEIISILVK